MSVVFPVYVLAKDCGDVYRFESVDEVNYHLEAQDAEGGEYDCWDSSGRIVQLVAENMTAWKSGRICMAATDSFELPNRFAEIIAKAERA